MTKNLQNQQPRSKRTVPLRQLVHSASCPRYTAAGGQVTPMCNCKTEGNAKTVEL